ncbi:MAG: rhodanese-like domain-containing protein [Acidimicrobiales bacterium]
MPATIDRDQVRRLLDEGAQVVEVLERTQYEAAHLPDAVHIPAWELTEVRAARELDRRRPVVVYCFDNL